MSSFRVVIYFYKSGTLSSRLLNVSRLFNARPSSSSQCCYSLLVKQKANIQDCCSILEVEKDCTETELRAAYLQKVKDHHPDRQKGGKDSAVFNNIYNAYHTLLDHKRDQTTFENDKVAAEDDEEVIIRHTAPQHRQFLTFEGVGFGTPSQRRQQYQQFRVARANERVFEHRKIKFGSSESAVVAKDKAHARKIRTSNLIHRLVDDLVSDAMQRGDFDNLAGKGKPLNYSDHNPMIDTTTHNLNKIMVNNGFMPEWIMLSKEIRTEISLARQKLAIIREQLGPPPYSEEDGTRFDFHVEKFHNSLRDINKNINRLNFIVPFMEKQMVFYDAKLNQQKVMDNHHLYLPLDKEGKPIVPSKFPPFPQKQSRDALIPWDEVWLNIKDLFKFKHKSR